jgi:hypothetical protein
VVALVVAAGERAGAPDVDFVEALARLELAARRLGLAVHVTHRCDELAALLDLTGLSAVVGGSGLRLEAGGEPEGREQLGIEEVVPPDDAPA